MTKDAKARKCIFLITFTLIVAYAIELLTISIFGTIVAWGVFFLGLFICRKIYYT